MASVLLLRSVRRRPVFCGSFQQLVRRQAQPLNGGGDPGPLFREKFLSFALQQQIARAVINEHAKASLCLDQLLGDQPLIGLQNRERVDPIFRRDIAHRRQRIAFLEHAVENHRDDTIAQLAIDWLTVVPLMIHSVSDTPTRDVRGFAPIECCVSYSDVVDYNTISPASFIFIFLCRPFRRLLA
jgi:hypothetical protein